MKLSRRALLRMAGGGAAAAALGAGYAFGIEPVWLRTVEHEVALRGLDAAFDGYRIVQLSDLHVGAGVPEAHLRGAVERANALSPDLVVLTGDYVHHGGTPALAEEVGSLLSALRAPDGILGVEGNHDRGVYRASGRGTRNDALEGALLHAGVRMLANECAWVERAGGARLAVAGYGDLWCGRFDAAAVDIPSLGAPCVALSHNPDTAARLAAAGASLVLSGHTHGGQVSLPFLGPPLLPVQDRRFAAGPYDIGSTRLYVNRGVGWLRRVRLFVRPEVTLHLLRAVS